MPRVERIATNRAADGLPPQLDHPYACSIPGLTAALLMYLTEVLRDQPLLFSLALLWRHRTSNKGVLHTPADVFLSVSDEEVIDEPSEAIVSS